ncbi:MAG: M28 family peptidase [Flavobacteriales bacterium]|nr:M28 family peptidase [Flavobacteriales bacterium]
MSKKILLYVVITFLITPILPLQAQQHPVVSSILSQVSIDSLMYRAEEISGYRGVYVNGVLDTIYSRHRTRQGNELAYRYIMQEFSSFGLAVDSQKFGSLGKNALAIQTGFVYPHRYFIFCSHYDGLPNTSIAPAADDDGSGVATVLEAARILSQYDFEYTILYAIWDEEEQGLIGSNAYATMAQNNNDTIMGVINLDAIAWDGNNDSVARIHVRPIADSESLGDSLYIVNERYDIGLNLMINNPGATYSDHASFWNKGFSALLFIEDWDNDPNPQYHTVRDSVTYFNISYYHRTSKLAIAALSSLAVPYINELHINLEDSENKALKVYPNPAVSSTLISLSSGKLNRIRIADVYGKIIIDQLVSGSEVNVSTDSWASGVYIIEAYTNNMVYKLKLLKSLH